MNAEFPFLQPQSEVSSSNQSMIVDTDKQIEINNNNFEFYQAPNYKFNPYTPSNEPYHHYPYWSQPNFQPNFAPQPDLTFLIPFYPQNDQPQTPSGFEKYSIPATKNTPIFPQFEGQTTPSIVNETAYPPLPQNNNQSLPINNQNLGESPSMFSNLFQRATEELSQNQIHLQQLQQEEHNVLIQQNDHANQPIYLNQRQNIIQPFTPSSRLKSIVKPHLQRNNSQRMEAIQNRNHSNIKTQLSSQIHSISSNESGLQNSNTMPFSTQQLQMLQQKSLTLDQPNLF